MLLLLFGAIVAGRVLLTYEPLLFKQVDENRELARAHKFLLISPSPPPSQNIHDSGTVNVLWYLPQNGEHGGGGKWDEENGNKMALQKLFGLFISNSSAIPLDTLTNNRLVERKYRNRLLLGWQSNWSCLIEFVRASRTSRPLSLPRHHCISHQ